MVETKGHVLLWIEMVGCGGGGVGRKTAGSFQDVEKRSWKTLSHHSPQLETAAPLSLIKMQLRPSYFGFNVNKSNNDAIETTLIILAWGGSSTGAVKPLDHLVYMD